MDRSERKALIKTVRASRWSRELNRQITLWGSGVNSQNEFESELRALAEIADGEAEIQDDINRNSEFGHYS